MDNLGENAIEVIEYELSREDKKLLSTGVSEIPDLYIEIQDDFDKGTKNERDFTKGC